MKKNKILKEVVASIIIASISLALFTGCQGNKTSNTASAKNKSAAANVAAMKTRMETSIKPLVTDKTITQAQADKIVTALTANLGNFSGQRNGQGYGQRNGQGYGQNGQNGESTAPSNNGQTSNTQNGQSSTGSPSTSGNNRQSTALAKLVTDGVITQAQADAVLKKISGSFTRPQGGNPQSDSSQDNTQNTQTSSS